MSPEYIQSVWWSLEADMEERLASSRPSSRSVLSTMWTGLSDHELALGYETVTDPSVYVRFPITSGPLAQLGRLPLGLDNNSVDSGFQYCDRSTSAGDLPGC